ncbi:uncharacterized protein LOC127532478 [Acanthochromis polyacanthus]|uniref:uncharacterized protein LOC127532478 n=1 Tax=Acanthochromis polyacanthus TaxID=80966 RepID=UPI0022349798|nr:uncharacterized protein LOC127532478 [Acanthochromis polyacanthus]
MQKVDYILFISGVAELNEVSQPVSVQTLNLGDSATIQCYIKSLMTKRVWYKLTTERKLQLVAKFDSHYRHSVLSNEFDWRYSVDFDKVDSHLSITATSWEDVGTYFCGVMHLKDIQFGSGTFLMLKVIWYLFQGAKMSSDSVVQQSESESVQSEDSILSGNGTKLIFHDGMEFDAVPNTILLVLIISLSLAFVLCFMSWTKCCDGTESRGGFSASTTTSAENHDGEHLKIKEMKSQRDDTWSECMYLSVKKYK